MKIALPVSTSKTQFYVNMTYVNYLSESGFEPIMVTPTNNFLNILAICDGLLLPGGTDIDPIYYGNDNFDSNYVDPEKDAFERKLFSIFRQAKKPIMGICRGLQLMALEFLYKVHNAKHQTFIDFFQHIPGHNQVENQGLKRNILQHYVNCHSKNLYNTEKEYAQKMAVNSMHHQCLVSDLKYMLPLSNIGFDILAWTQRGLKIKGAGTEIIIEAFSINNWGGKMMAVQWHPEELLDKVLIQNFFEIKHKKVKNVAKNNTQVTKVIG